ncbi:hypothetical protein J6590_048047 [Homalodisca vitripennis]|nr:hypothetical protein J6590_048047 [Homalodisca vitripennis]
MGSLAPVHIHLSRLSLVSSLGEPTVGVTKECSWRRPIERIGQRDVATQQVPYSQARRVAVTARNKFGNVAQSSLAAPRSRAK